LVSEYAESNYKGGKKGRAGRSEKKVKKSGLAKLDENTDAFINAIKYCKTPEDIKFIHDQLVFPVKVKRFSGNNFDGLTALPIGTAYGKESYSMNCSCWSAAARNIRMYFQPDRFALIDGGFISGLFTEEEGIIIQDIYGRCGITAPGFTPEKKDEADEAFTFSEGEDTPDEEDEDEVEAEVEEDGEAEGEGEGESGSNSAAAVVSSKPAKAKASGGAGGPKLKFDDDESDSDDDDAGKRSRKKKDKKITKGNKGHKTSNGRRYKGSGGGGD
jgi:hypothetical protein